MSVLALGLLIVCAVATCAIYIAGSIGYGSPWANDVCSLAGSLCDNPAWSVIGTSVVAALYLTFRQLEL